MTRKTFKRYWCLILIATLTSVINAEPDAWKKNGTQGTYPFGSSDYVNLFNGNLNFTLPLFQVKGRGNTSISIPLSITQQSWRAWQHFEPSFMPCGSCTNQPTYYCSVNSQMDYSGSTYYSAERGYCSQSSTGGHGGGNQIFMGMLEWRGIRTDENPVDYVGYGPGVFYAEYKKYGDEITFPSMPVSERLSFKLVLPDGSTQMFVDTKTMGQAKAVTLVNQQNVYFDRGTNFTTIDGSSTTFVSDTPINDGYAFFAATAVGLKPSGYLFKKDGTKYRIADGLIRWIRDVNGNQTSFVYDEPSTFPYERRRLTKITDSLGREVTFVYDLNDGATAPDGTPYGIRDEIRYKGLGGADQKTVVAKTDLGNALKSGQTLQPLSVLWDIVYNQGVGLFRKDVIWAVWMPDGRAVKFEYNSFAELARVVLPTGSSIEYDYSYASNNYLNGVAYSGMAPRRRIQEKRLYATHNDPTSLVSKTTFGNIFPYRVYGDSSPTVTQPVQVDTSDADGNLLTRTKHYFLGDPTNATNPNGLKKRLGFEDALTGKEIKTEIINPLTQEVFQRVEYTWQLRIPEFFPFCNVSQCTGTFVNTQLGADPRLVETKTTLVPNQQGGLVTKTSAINPSDGTIGFDANNNPTDTWEYDYGVGNVPVRPARHEHVDYLIVNPVNGVNYAGPSNGLEYALTDLHLRRLPSKIFRYSINQATGIETLIAKSEVRYDEPTYPILSEQSVTGWMDPQHGSRGNPTTSRLWSQEANNWLEGHAQFDQFGNLRKVWDASGDPGRFTETQYSADYLFAFPTKLIGPPPDFSGTYGTSESSTTETTYDFHTGVPLTAKNDFGHITAIEYDGALRPTRTYGVNVMAPETRTEYGDTPGNLFVKVRKQIYSNYWDEVTSFLDGLGRTIKTKSKDSQGDVFTETHYDAIGRIDRITNPYREGGTVLWSKTRYDELGRAVETYGPVTFANLPSAPSLGVASLDISTVPNYIGTVVTVDISGRKTRSIINAQDQVIRADEPTSMGHSTEFDLGPLASPHQATSYSYDIRGNLSSVSQGLQTRSFIYDSLSRIVAATNPESGTVEYTYDVLGNVKTKRDARGIKTIYDYDNWNRIVKRCYRSIGSGPLGATSCAQAISETPEPNTPDVAYFYDGKGLGQPGTFTKGKLTKIQNAVSETLFISFDNFGRLLKHEQVTDGKTYTTGYKYSFSGDLIEQTYPSGKIVITSHDIDGDISAVTKSGRIFAADFSYTPEGSVAKLRLGNGNWETSQFSALLKPTQLALGSSENLTDLWKVNYEYGELQSNGTVDQTKNVGSMAKQILTIPNANGENGFIAVQNYTYDFLNRLKNARETIFDNETWSQTFEYDRFGNRNFNELNTSTLPKACTENGHPVVCVQDRKIFNPAVDQANNRLDAGYGYQYDAVGNMTRDSENKTYAYDALNKQTQVKNANNQPIGTYHYDGEGNRIKKIGGVENVVFVYDGFGRTIAEYLVDNQPSPTPQTNYITTDTLGSPRIVTNQEGKVVSRRDFLPFGEEVATDAIHRRDVLGYNESNTIRQKFTGYEHDAETELDFAINRYYSSRLGRFTSADPLMSSGKIWSPQSWNRYAYANNNPLNLTDPLGLDPERTAWWYLPCSNGSCSPVFGTGYTSLNQLIQPGNLIYSNPEVSPYLWALNPFTGAVQSFANTAQGMDEALKWMASGGAALTAAAEAFLPVAAAVAIVAAAAANPDNAMDGCGRPSAGMPCYADMNTIHDMDKTKKASEMTEDQLQALVPPVVDPPPPGKDPNRPSAPANPKSRPQFGHTFDRHGAGSKTTRNLAGRAERTGKPQGQWTDNQLAADFLSGLGQANGLFGVKLPKGMGQLVRADGSVVPATRAIVVPSRTGIKTAYPVQ